MTTVITAKLSLAVRLLDTTNGKEISEPDVRFAINGLSTTPMKKGEGVYVFVNIGREDFLMQVNVRGFDQADVNVMYEKLDPGLPMIDLFLMPSEKNRQGGEVLEINGTLSDLEYIEAINLDRPVCYFQSDASKKTDYKINLLPLTAGGGVVLDTIRYALMDEAEERYDSFTVKDQKAPLSVSLTEPIANEHKLNDKIFRIIYGRAGPDGRFVLKVRDDKADLPHLIHFKVGDEEYFRKADLHELARETDLMEGAVSANALTRKEEEQDERTSDGDGNVPVHDGNGTGSP